MVTIAKLEPKHAKALNRLTIDAIRDYPAAFTTDYSQVRHRPFAMLIDHLRELERTRGFRLGAFDTGGELVGTVRLIPRQGPKLAHSADVVFLYVRRDRQRQGIGRALLERLIDEAGRIDGLEQLELSVSSDSLAARQLYEQAGFEITGVQRRQIKVGEDYHDLIAMWRQLERAPAGERGR